MIKFQCACGLKLSLQDTFAWKVVTCNKCGQADIDLPGPGEELIVVYDEEPEDEIIEDIEEEIEEEIYDDVLEEVDDDEFEFEYEEPVKKKPGRDVDTNIIQKKNNPSEGETSRRSKISGNRRSSRRN